MPLVLDVFQRFVKIQLSPKAVALYLRDFFHISYYFDPSIVYKVSLSYFRNALSFCSDHSSFLNLSCIETSKCRNRESVLARF